MLLLRKNNFKKALMCLLCANLIVIFNGCSRVEKKYSEEQAVLGTYVRVDVCRKGLTDDKIKLALGMVWQRFQEIEQRMNAYDSASEIGQINAHPGQAISVHEDVYGLIQYAIDSSETTQGAFDITVRPLVNLWQQAEELNKMPTQEEIDRAKVSVGVRLVRFPEPVAELRVSCDGCQLDLGGIAKGYAVDEAAKILRGSGIDDFLVDAGGNLYANGKNCEGNQWRIAIRHPRLEGEWVDVFSVSNIALSTSGDYERFYEVEGKVFSHIINPITGMPQEGVISATVIAPTAVEADVFSTALTVWSPDQGISFINTRGEGYAALIIVEKDGKLEFIPSEQYRRIGGQKFTAGKQK